MRVLVVGGYGTFGGHLVELLEEDPRLTLIVGGRSLIRAQRFCANRTGASATLLAAAFDRNAPAPQLQELRPDIVVDASGPFQVYGPTPYVLIEQCVQSRVNYLDLADGSDFVAGVPDFNSAAIAAGIFVLTGMSSCPVLTAAVVRTLAQPMRSIIAIRGGIAPSPFSGVGANVVRAIASYAGQPIALWRNGGTAVARPFVETLSYVISPPGQLPLRWRRFSLVDVPDLLLLPRRWPELRSVWIGAGPVPLALQRLLNLSARLVQWRVIPRLSWMAGAMHFVTEHARWGEHRGGMFVEIQGTLANGRETVRAWHLIAEGNDGPFIPSMAAAAVIKNCLRGAAPPPGARAGIDDVRLDDYERLFATRKIHTGIREDGRQSTTGLYEYLLGNVWQQLAAPIRQLHTVTHSHEYQGRCTVRRGRNWLARLVARINGFPEEGEDKALIVRLERNGDKERWTRTCEGRRFTSVQSAGRGCCQWLLRERFGPVSVDMALLLEEGSLRYEVRGWAFCGLPLPISWGLRSTAQETVQDGLFKFDVQISHPLIGLIVHYTGTLAGVEGTVLT